MSPENAKPFDALGLAAKHGQGADEQTAIRFFGQLLLGTPPSEAWLDRITADLNRNRWSSADRMRRSIAHLLASAQAQLG